VEFLDRLLDGYLADETLSTHESADLANVARLLGLTGRLQERIAAARARGRELSPAKRKSTPALSGLSVCFTGEFEQTFRGQRLTRIEVERVSSNAGLVVKPAVTKKLDLLVCADSATESGKARKARLYGIRIMHAAEFLRQLEQLF
jgi:DNA polymerase-3 subunit epsilon